MKKILFATTALVATAGVASADVAVSGFAELGIFDNGGATTQVHTDIDVTFSMSGTADNGVGFSAGIDLDELDGDGDTSNDQAMPDATIGLSFGPASLTVGDTDSAFDARLTEVAMNSAIQDDHTIHPGYNGNSALDEALDSQVVRFDYALDAFTVSLSVNSDDTANLDPTYALGASFSADLGVALGVGVGYIKGDEALTASVYDEIIGLSLSAGFGSISTVLNFSNWTDNTSGGADDASHIALGVGTTIGALAVSANYGEYDLPGGNTNGFGLAANYDLGGGLVAQFGFSSGDNNTAAGYDDTYSLGLAMSF